MYITIPTRNYKNHLIGKYRITNIEKLIHINAQKEGNSLISYARIKYLI